MRPASGSGERAVRAQLQAQIESLRAELRERDRHPGGGGGAGHGALEAENERLRAELAALRSASRPGAPPGRPVPALSLGGTGGPASGVRRGSVAPVTYELSPNVLILDAAGRPLGRERLSDVVRGLASRRTADLPEPDTPRKTGAAGGVRGSSGVLRGPPPTAGREYFPFEAIVEDSEMARLSRLEAQASVKDNTPIAERVLTTLRRSWRPALRRFDYTGVSKRLLTDGLIQLCFETERVLRSEKTCLELSTPAWVFGDIHGNYADLFDFLEVMVPFGDLRYTPTRLLFLGDYVDRGEHSLECVALLFALKCIAPCTVYMLRGNHESPEVNGDSASYGDGAFRTQCAGVLGPEMGETVWASCNRAFRFLPLCAILDSRIFCAHGGIPRYGGGADDRMATLRDPAFPRFDAIQVADPAAVPEDPRTMRFRQVANDLVWSDPAEEGELATLDHHGFGMNPRGAGCVTFGGAAVDAFLALGFDFVLRAHQEKADGLKLSADFRVVTIFSTSDYAGHRNGAGVVFVADGKIRLLVKRPPPDTT